MARAKGLEVGPLANPVVAKTEGDITYIDYADADTLRRIYSYDQDIRPERIVEIDAVWGDRSLADCLAGRHVDYIIASHVAEHIPDLVTWLEECRSVLAPGAELRLALPDRRFSNDVLRAPTTIVELLAAHILGARRPQVRDVLDFRLNTTDGIDPSALYDGRTDPATLRPVHTPTIALQSAAAARDQPEAYFDVHCLVVQPREFAALMGRLGELGLLRLACASMTDTTSSLYEFYVFMRPCDDAGEVARSWQEVRETLADPLPGSAAAARATEAADEALAGLSRARAELAAMQASLSWRVTAPLRRIRRWAIERSRTQTPLS